MLIQHSVSRDNARIQPTGFEFTPFRPTPLNEILLSQAGLPPQTELISFERNGEHRTVIAHQMMYHHLIQGELAGEPYLVAF